VAGRLRPRPRRQGTPRESPASTHLPLLEAAAASCGLPGAFGLGRELELAGFFELGLLDQWRLVQEQLAEHALEAPDPLAVARALAASEEPRVRFHAPGVLARLLRESPLRALAELHPLARDADFRVAEAVQAFGVRPQAEALGPEVVAPLLDWARDPSPEVRRAAVEGTRARGVWVRHLDWVRRQPALVLPLLEALRRDPARKVANAVGNALNDLSRDHPGLVLAVAGRWLAEQERGPWCERIAAKGLRTLVKEGDARALALLGFPELELEAEVEREGPEEVPPNHTLRFRLRLRSPVEARARLIYEVQTPGRQAGRPRRQRHAGGTLELPAGETVELRLRERIFDRRTAPLLDGPGRVLFFVNGREVGSAGFRIRRSLRSATGGSGPGPGPGR